MIAIIDYGVGNLFSLSSSIKSIGGESVITGDPEVIRKADQLILPGVGAFGDASAKLFASGLDVIIKEEVAKGKPLMGICLGMQLLFEEGHEYGIHKGLGLIPGKVIPMEGMLPEGLNIPHIGWNALQFKKESPLFKDLNEGEFVYFVHSYYGVECEEYITATAKYGIDVTASVQKDNVYGCQFHPEKSGDTGMKILRSFCQLGV